MSITKPRRIYVIGGAGSGKTTLARQLSNCLSLPLHELDKGADLDSVLHDAEWVIEGVYLWRLESAKIHASGPRSVSHGNTSGRDGVVEAQR